MGTVAKESQFQVRVSEEEKTEWAQAAKADECDSVSQWFRKLARERIKAQFRKAKRQDP